MDKRGLTCSGCRVNKTSNLGGFCVACIKTGNTTAKPVNVKRPAKSIRKGYNPGRHAINEKLPAQPVKIYKLIWDFS